MQRFFFPIYAPCFVAFLEPQIQLAIDQSLPTPTYQCKALGTNKIFERFLLIPECFIQEALPKVDFYHVSMACLQLDIGSGESQLLHSKSQHAFFVGCMDAYKCDAGAYFVWVPIILVLWQTLIQVAKVPYSRKKQLGTLIVQAYDQHETGCQSLSTYYLQRKIGAIC